MMNKTLAILSSAVFAAAADAAAAPQLPEEYKVFFSNQIDTRPAATLRFEDEKMVLEHSTVSAGTIKRSGNKLDLRSVMPDKKITNAAVVGAIYADKPGTLRIGMGVDWWFDCYCNGQYVFGTSDSGNGTWPPSSKDYIFDLNLRAGRNDLVIFTRSGRGSWDIMLEVMSKSKEVNLPRRVEEKPQVTFGPYLTNPSGSTVSISYIVRGRQPLELEYRKKGNRKWLKKQLLRGGQLLDQGPVMRFDLDELKPDTVYEYRALKRVGEDLFKAEADKVREFRTPAEKSQDFSFWMLADTHKGKLAKLEFLKRLLKSRPELKKAEMFMHLGDFNSYIDDIELEIFDSFLKLIPHEQYIVTMRGNHEFDGAQAGRYTTYLGTRDCKSYQAFKYGDVFFIILDTGHHLPADSTNSYIRYTGLNELDTLWAEQRQWLKEVVKSKEFAEARFRIVCAHIAPHGQPDSFNHMQPRLHKMTTELFKGDPAAYPVHLWFAGHMHKYKQADPAEDWQFPVITLGGGSSKSIPGAAVYVQVKGKEMLISVFNSDGTVLERFKMNTNQPGIIKKLP